MEHTKFHGRRLMLFSYLMSLTVLISYLSFKMYAKMYFKYILWAYNLYD